MNRELSDTLIMETRQRQPRKVNDTMITIENAKVETLNMNQARPVGSTVLAVTIGNHTFQMLVDENELIDALASNYAGRDMIRRGKVVDKLYND